MTDTPLPRKLFRGDTGWPLGNLEIEVEVSDKTDGDLVCVRSVEGKPFSLSPNERFPFDAVLSSDIWWTAYRWVRPSQLHDLPANNVQLRIDNLTPPEVAAWQDEAEALARDAADFAATEQNALGTLY